MHSESDASQGAGSGVRAFSEVKSALIGVDCVHTCLYAGQELRPAPVLRGL